MDDIFFSDKPNQNKAKRKPATDDVGSQSQDAFAADSAAQPAKRKFVVQLPNEERDVVLRDRTPKGRPVMTDPVTPKVPDYTPTQTSSFDDSVYMRPAQQNQPSMTNRPPQPRPTTAPPNRQRPAQSQQQRQQRPQQQRPQQQGQQARSVSSKRRPSHGKGGKGSGGVSKGKVIAIILLVLAMLFTGMFAYGYSILGKVSYDKDFVHDNSYVESGALARSGRVRNILCIGSDARSEIGGQRSDTMVLLSIDSAHHQLKMTSFLRDAYVYIPAKGYNAKLNAAFAWGGAKMLMDTIEYNFKIDIDDYLIIDFEGFQKLIDLMGGLDVDGVTAEEARYMRDVVKIIYCKEGKNHFTGAASLWYCRIRKLDDDFHRTERQRKVMNAIMKQALHRSPFKLMKIVEQVLPMLQTSMSRNDLLSVGFSAVFNYIGGKKPQHQVPAEDTWSGQRVNGQDVLRLDMEKNTQLLQQFLYP